MINGIQNATLSLSRKSPTADKNVLNRLSRRLVRPVDGVTLAGFRLLFGLVMILEIVRIFGRIPRYYVEPDFFFTYEFLPMVSPWPEPWIYLHFLAMGLFAAGLMLGLFYRLAAVLFCLSYTYVFLLDKSQYQNHYYLIILLSFLLIFVDAHRVASLDRRRQGFGREPGGELVPYWQLFILQAQIVIVYFYAGLAKVNADWLSLEPVRVWLTLRADYPLVGPLFTTEAAAILIGYGGLLFDLSIGFLLLWRRTRPLAIAAVLFFHLTNSWLFSIGLLPFLMIATTILFVDPGWLRALLGRAKPAIPAHGSGPKRFSRRWITAFVLIYLAIQLLVPLRHLLYPGSVFWNDEGFRFSWLMKSRSKVSIIAFYVTDPATGQTWQVDARRHLTGRQLAKMSTRPDMIVQFVDYIEQELEAAGQIEDPIIRVEALASLNGRPLQLFIDPEVDLSEAQYGGLFDHATWIMPIEFDVSGQLLAEK